MTKDSSQLTKSLESTRTPEKRKLLLDLGSCKQTISIYSGSVEFKGMSEAAIDTSQTTSSI